MERRNKSIKIFEEFIYIDSLDGDLKAKKLLTFFDKEFSNINIQKDFDLPFDKLKVMSELFYKNIIFVKQYQNNIKAQIKDHKSIKKFLT